MLQRRCHFFFFLFIHLPSESMPVLQKNFFVFLIYINLPIIILPGTERYSLLFVLPAYEQSSPQQNRLPGLLQESLV